MTWRICGWEKGSYREDRPGWEMEDVMEVVGREIGIGRGWR